MRRNILLGRKRPLILVLTLLAVVSISAATMFSLALFTDQQTDDSAFTAGTVVLDPTKIAAMDLTTSAIMPGDEVSSPVEVQNNGDAQLRYSVSQTSTNADSKDLRSALMVVVREADTGGGTDFASDGDYCNDATGTVVHASAAMGDSGNLVGNPSQGAQAGDRTLDASASEVLCFYVSLPFSASNSLQGATTTTTFTFDAEQTVNNP